MEINKSRRRCVERSTFVAMQSATCQQALYAVHSLHYRETIYITKSIKYTKFSMYRSAADCHQEIKLKQYLIKTKLATFLGHNRDEVTGEWRKLSNEELNDLYCS